MTSIVARRRQLFVCFSPMANRGMTNCVRRLALTLFAFADAPRCELLAVGSFGVVRASRAFTLVLMGTVVGGAVAALWCCTTQA